MLVKIHEAYRKIVAVCDTELLGKKFEQDNMQLDVKRDFYGGTEMSEEDALKLITKAKKEDACFNFVGKNSINLAIKSGLCDGKSILIIQGVPHCLFLF